MTILFLLIGVSLSVAVCFLGAFLWATKSGQYEDTYTPGVRMLFEEEHSIAQALVTPADAFAAPAPADTPP